jgi:hypothetical protein
MMSKVEFLTAQLIAPTLSPIGNGTDEQPTERKAPIQSLFPTAACLLRASSYYWMNCLGHLGSPCPQASAVPIAYRPLHVRRKCGLGIA